MERQEMEGKQRGKVLLVTHVSGFVPQFEMNNVRILPAPYTHLRAHETRANLVCGLLLDHHKHQLIQNLFKAYWRGLPAVVFQP